MKSIHSWWGTRWHQHGDRGMGPRDIIKAQIICGECAKQRTGEKKTQAFKKVKLEELDNLMEKGNIDPYISTEFVSGEMKTSN